MLVDIKKLRLDDRARVEFSTDKHSTLIQSLQRPAGLLHPLVVTESADGTYQIQAGERRFKAISALYAIDEGIRHANEAVPIGQIPVTVIAGDVTTAMRLQIELDENAEREDFTPYEQIQLKAKIAKIMQQQLEEQKPVEKRKAVIGLGDISAEAMKAATEKLNSGRSGTSYSAGTRTALKAVSRAEAEPDSKLSKQLRGAKSTKEIEKLLKKDDQEKLHAKLAVAQGSEFNSAQHSIIQGDCLEVLKTLPRGSFDVCLTDPLYGMDAHKFGNSAGHAVSFDHNYDDSPETWRDVMPKALAEVTRLLKPNAHMYLACDILRFEELKEMVKALQSPLNPWVVQRTPIIQYKKEGGRIPHPGYTFRRSYETWLYAYRGDKQEYHCMNDVIETVSGGTETHGAGKPIELLKTFLRRSTLPGDSCLDFMAGSGSIIPACHEAKVKCTAIEIGKTSYGRCLQRVKELKKS